MATYWISFSIEKDRTYQRRYDALHEAIGNLTTGKCWTETTSFILFSSSAKIDGIAKAISAALDIEQDIALIGMTEFKSCRIIGAWLDPDLTELIPFVQNG